MKARGTLRTRRPLNTCQGYGAQHLMDKDGRREGPENPEPGRGHPKLQGLSSLDHKDNFPKEEEAQTRDFPRLSDVELD